MYTEPEPILSGNDLNTLKEAFTSVRNSIQWKPYKATAHLEKRRNMGHIASAASLGDYEEIISSLVHQDDNALYLYEFQGKHYYVVRGFYDTQEWVVIFGAKGVMETAFPPQDTDDYINRRGFLYLGRIKEVLEWTTKPGN